MVKKLSDIEKQQSITIESIDLGDKKSEEMLEVLGFTPGTKATVMSTSFLSGPMTVHIRGAKFAIRKKDADAIAVTV